MSEIKQLENKMVSLFEKVDERFAKIDQRFDAMDQRFDAMDQRFDDLETDVAMIRVEMNHGYNELSGKIDGLDKRVGHIESVIQERWDIPEIKTRLEAVETVVQSHSDKIKEFRPKSQKG